jgi:hypothetical protein
LTHCLTTVTTVDDETMETKAHSLSYLNTESDTLLMNNVWKVGDLFLSTTSCLGITWQSTMGNMSYCDAHVFLCGLGKHEHFLKIVLIFLMFILAPQNFILIVW